MADSSSVLIGLFRRFARRIPGAIVAVVLAAVVVSLLHLDDKVRWGRYAVETIGSRFKGGIPRALLTFNFGFLQSAPYEKIQVLIPKATTIAMLAAIESLLCYVVAHRMIGGRHRGNTELIAQSRSRNYCQRPQPKPATSVPEVTRERT